MVDTSICTCISNHTSTIKHTHKVLAIAHYCSLYMFTTDANAMLLVCTYNLELKSKKIEHISPHAPVSTLAMVDVLIMKTCRTVLEGLARGLVPVFVRYTKCCTRHCIQARREGSWLHRMHKVPSTISRFECTPLTLSCRSGFASAPRRSSTTLWRPLKLAVLSAV